MRWPTEISRAALSPVRRGQWFSSSLGDESPMRRVRYWRGLVADRRVRDTMSKQGKDVLYVMAAAYDNVDAAVADYESVKQVYRAIKTSHSFDATVIAKDADGTVKIVKKHEQPTRHGGAVGLAWGLGVGVVSALFPPVGIGLATAGAGGAAIGAIAGHVSGGLSRHDLKELGEALDAGTAGLIVVYETNLADQVAANIKAANRIVSKATDMEADRLAADIKKAETAAAPERAATVSPSGE
ncbi:DUF1269 domain-containing protein [Saccharomonospora sp. NPDC046836]|uniref:DUF1269 domain-containing protein n=1 Tax=Saccharomonospora sp. NPDC046836 TaxID=3156921 RepID=UPI0033DE1763